MEQIQLKSKDGTLIVVESTILKHSAVLLEKIEKILPNGTEVDTIHVPEANAAQLAVMIEWMKHIEETSAPIMMASEESEIPNNQEQHVVASKPKVKIDQWDVAFCERHQEQAFRLMVVANRLKIESFIQIGTSLLFDWLLDKSASELRDIVCVNIRESSTNTGYDDQSDMMDFSTNETGN